MRSISRFVAICSFVTGVVLVPTALAQDEPRAAWVITSYDITVPPLGNDRALSARATIAARNVGRGPGSTLTVRINSAAEIKSVTVGTATATYQSRPESRGPAQRIPSQRVTISLPSPVAPNQNVVAIVEYRLPVDENTGVA